MIPLSRSALAAGCVATCAALTLALAPQAVAVPSAPAVVPAQAAPAPQTATIAPDGWFTEAVFAEDFPGSGLVVCGNKDEPSPVPCRTTPPQNVPADMTSAVTFGSPDFARSQTGVSAKPGPGGQVALGQPFTFAEWTFLNRPVVNIPQNLLRAYRGTLVVTPAGGTPFTFVLDDPTSPVGTYGKRDPMRVPLRDTPNRGAVELCDQAVQRSTVPCDDQVNLELAGPRPPVFTQVENGVTWKLEILGWDSELNGGVTRSVSTEENRDTRAPLQAVLSVETRPTTTTVSGPPGPTVAGSPATFTATVDPAVAPGTVAFRDGDTAIAGCTAVPLVAGRASCTTSALPAGQRTIFADYSGMLGFGPSSGSVPHTVVPPDPALLCTSGATPQGYNVVRGTPRDEVLYGTPGNDLILTGGGNNVVYANGGDDVVCGGPGKDVLYGQAGDDVLVGGPGDDFLDGGPGTDRGIDSDPRTVRTGIERNN